MFSLKIFKSGKKPVCESEVSRQDVHVQDAQGLAVTKPSSVHKASGTRHLIGQARVIIRDGTEHLVCHDVVVRLVGVKRVQHRSVSTFRCNTSSKSVCGLNLRTLDIAISRRVYKSPPV